MFITKVLSYNGAWGKLLKEQEETFFELQEILSELPSYEQFLDAEVNKHDKTLSLAYLSDLGHHSSQIADKKYGWSDYCITPYENKNRLIYLGQRKNNLVFSMERDSSLPGFVYDKIYYLNEINEKTETVFLGFCFLNETIIDDLKRNDINEKYFDSYVMNFEFVEKELNRILPNNIKTPFLIFGLDFERHNIKVREMETINEPIMIERSIEFKPEHYQAGLGILSYFGTVMRKKYPEQNAKVKIEQEDDKVRLIVESENGDQEIIERAFDEFGLVIHQDIKPENFYDNYLDVAELKTKLGTFESELKFQHQLVEMKEHRIIELEKDRNFLKNVISQALVRPHSPIYINNHLNNTQNIAIDHKAELNQSYDDLDKLIYLVDKDSLKKCLERALTAIDVAQNLDEPEEVKNSGGMKQLAKILNEANEVGTEVNDLVEQGGKAFELMKNLGRKYNSVAEWCGLPVIPSVFVKE